jgi:glycopeptide antibiotics resistance protein
MPVALTPYFLPIQTAALLFPLIAFAITLPYAVYSYRRYGSISILRIVIFYSMIFYLLAAYYIVILPLPDPQLVAVSTDPFFQLIPFNFVADFLRESGFIINEPGTWPRALINRSFMIPFFNMLLVLPWGVYLTYYYRARFRTVLVLSLALSLFFEISQLSGLFGLYPRPYRLFDVDDLLLNTLGGCLGFWITTRVQYWLPSRDAIDERSRRRSAQVSYLRRFVAGIIDYLLIGALLMLADGLISQLVPAWPGSFGPLALPLVFCLYSIILPLLWKGQTLGKALVRIRVGITEENAGGDTGESSASGAASASSASSDGGDGESGESDASGGAGGGGIGRLLVRYHFRNALFFAFMLCGHLIFVVQAQIVPMAIQLVIALYVLIDLLVGLRHQRQLLYERVSRTRNKSTYPLVDPGTPIDLPED